jgi:hypothetical protein
MQQTARQYCRLVMPFCDELILMHGFRAKNYGRGAVMRE